MTATETKWAERVREWKASGKGAEEFAAGRDFKASTLQFWASRLRQGPRKAAAVADRSPSVPMARVTPTSQSAASSLCIIVGPVRIEVRGGFDRFLLRDLVETLGALR